MNDHQASVTLPDPLTYDSLVNRIEDAVRGRSMTDQPTLSEIALCESDFGQIASEDSDLRPKHIEIAGMKLTLRTNVRPGQAWLYA